MDVLSHRPARKTAERGRDGGLSTLAARYGFRRVERVHIRTRDGVRVATVTGVTHRYPRVVRVPVSVAARLVAAGAPLLVEGPTDRAV